VTQKKKSSKSLLHGAREGKARTQLTRRIDVPIALAPVDNYQRHTSLSVQRKAAAWLDQEEPGVRSLLLVFLATRGTKSRMNPSTFAEFDFSKSLALRRFEWVAAPSFTRTRSEQK
jgi:hypothetical protein